MEPNRVDELEEYMKKIWDEVEIDQKLEFRKESYEEQKSYELKLAIAKIAYREIRAAIDECEIRLNITCHWNEYISVDDEVFYGYELRDSDL